MEAAKVAKGAAYIGIMNLMDALIAFGFYFGMARILPPSDVGFVSMIFLVITAFNTFTLLALNSAVTKYVAEFTGADNPASASAAARKTLRILLLVSIPAFAIAAVLSPWISSIAFGGGLSTTALLVILLGALVMNFTNYCGAVMYGLGLFGDVAAQNIVFYALSRVPGLILAFLGLGVIGVSSGLLMGSLAALIYSVARLRGKLVGSHADFPSKRLLSFSLPIYVSNVLALGQGWLDVILLYMITGSSTSVGIYYLVIGAISVVSMVSTPVTSTVFPAMSHRYGENGVEGIRDLLSSAFRILTITVVPLSVGLSAVAPTALKVAYGSVYSQSALAFAILTLFAILRAYCTLFSNVLQVLEKTFQVLLVVAIGLSADGLVIVATAETLGTVGAALGRSSMTIVMLLILYVILRKISDLNLRVDHMLFAKVLALSIIIGVPMFVLDSYLGSGSARPILIGVMESGLFLFLGSIGLRIMKPFNSDDLVLLDAVLPERLRPVAHFFT